MATYYAFGRLVPQHRNVGSHRFILRDRHLQTDILHHHYCGCESWHLDLPQLVCRRWFCGLRHYTQSPALIFAD